MSHFLYFYTIVIFSFTFYYPIYNTKGQNRLLYKMRQNETLTIRFRISVKQYGNNAYRNDAYKRTFWKALSEIQTFTLAVVNIKKFADLFMEFAAKKNITPRFFVFFFTKDHLHEVKGPGVPSRSFRRLGHPNIISALFSLRLRKFKRIQVILAVQ